MKSSHGFSLVEVTIAIGILSFCLIAILGLMPSGMQVVNRAQEESLAMQTLAAIAASIRSASSTDNTNYTAAAPFTNLNWSIGGDRVNSSFLFTEEAVVATGPESNARQRIFISLSPPKNASDVGTAYIGVAWPSATQVGSWTAPTEASQAAAPVLTKEKGYVSSTVVFQNTP